MNERTVDIIRDFVDARNRPEGLWRAPLVGFADARDLLLARLHDVVCPEHMMPAEALAGAKAAVVYFIPFTKEVAQGNAGDDPCPRLWAEAYVKTNELIIDLNRHLTDELESRGHRTALFPPTHDFDPERLVSAWSHKHVAFIAGLGRFGLHQMIITDAGCAGRLGSLVTDAPMAPTPRSTQERCLFLRDGSCKRCRERCPVNAIGEGCFDRHRCYQVCLANQRRFQSLGIADACGKCACGVPCSHADPTT